MTWNTTFIILLILSIKCISCANILFITPVASPSHHIWNRALAMGLLGKGHNITMLSHDAEKGPMPNNFTLILFEGLYEQEEVALDIDLMADQTALSSIVDMYEWASYCCEYDLNTAGFQSLLNYPKDYKFDLIIFDVTVGQCLYPTIERFHNPPVVAITPFLLSPVLSHSFGNHLYTSYMPYYHSEFTNKMNFMERLLNFVYIYSEILYRNYVFVPKQMALAKKHFGENVLSLEDTERSISLLLTNVDPVLDYPIALPPNIIPVAGLHIKPSGKLPQDLQVILDEAKQGVVLFSLGTNIRSDQLQLSTRNALLSAFAKMPQIVLWKFETENLEGLPKNVIIRKWLPQNDILGHKNTKLFISHGGALSTQEAMYHGVPMIGMPIFADQGSIVGMLVQKKVALSLDIKSLTFENLHKALAEILNNPIYMTNMKQLSKRYRDQSQTPLERAIFWVEYVLRHGSAEHLNTPARDMPFYQTTNLDILGVFVLGIILIYSFCLLILTVFKFVFVIRHPDLNKSK